MVFSSTLFIFIFLPMTFLGYIIVKGRGKNYWLLIMSLLFFAWSQPNYLWIILLSIVINYVSAMLIDNLNSLRKTVMFFSVVANLTLLFYFKYFDFFIDTINKTFGLSIGLHNIILPIGVSFFTFQGMSYVIDVYRKKVKVQRNPAKVALYITLFPQLIAGPIVRYKDIVSEIDSRKFNLDDFCEGISRFIVGLAKKVLIANTMASMVDTVWGNGCDSNSWSVAWIASIAYTLQIYFDFSGYSDMAIGLGRMFGFHFGENFDLPYVSENISEFWRRWHISLSSWFRDYVYIPLGGNRKNVYLNLAIVFVFTGIWHGAAWHFIAWGIWNGAFILLERYIMSKKHFDSKPHKNQFLSIISKIYTLLIINFGWILFRTPDMKEAINYFKSMFGMADYDKIGYSLGWYLDKWTVFMLIIGIIFSTRLPRRFVSLIKTVVCGCSYCLIKYATLIIIFGFSVMRIVSGTYNPFIYFQF